MNLDKLYAILADTTAQFRKGEEVEHRNGATHVFAIPHISEARPHIERVDMEFVVIGVDLLKARTVKNDLMAILDTYPDLERLASGPSYIEVGAEIGSQGAAFQLFALGKSLGLWDVITPASMGLKGEQARQLAGAGFIMISGYQPQEVAA